MTIYLVRHAHAGSRHAGEFHDRYRPLSDKGWKRSRILADILGGLPISRIISSPATRCVQTVEPLADVLGLEIAEDESLWEDAATHEVMAVLDAHVDEDIVVCSHGNLIPVIVEQLAAGGAKVKGRGCEKGSVWVLDHNGKRFTRASYISKNNEMVLD